MAKTKRQPCVSQGLTFCGPLAQQVLNPTPLNPTPATCHKRKRKLRCSFRSAALQKTALQHWLFCNAEVIWPKSCAAAYAKLHCNIEKAALQESGAFLPLSCGFQAPTFRHPRLGPFSLASHDSNPYPNRSRIARYNATKVGNFGAKTICLFVCFSSSEGLAS